METSENHQQVIPVLIGTIQPKHSPGTANNNVTDTTRLLKG